MLECAARVIGVHTTTSTAAVKSDIALRARAERLVSLDLFRGFVIAFMILVNDPGDGPSSYWPLKHAEWNGWTPTDLVFPSFLFIVGVAMAFSFRSRRSAGQTRSTLLKHAAWRGVVLFGVGLLLNGLGARYHLDHWRVYGVLQRIAICYVITAALELWTGWRAQIAVAIACLAAYWVLMRYVPVPGFGIPTRDIPLLDPDRNLVAWLDRKLLMGHLYEGTRDPEGLISTIPAIATSLLGLLTGKWLRTQYAPGVKTLGMIGAGVAAITAGKIMDMWFPINKKLWASSYVVFTAGLALICLAVCYWIVDVRRHRGWTWPILVFGTNAIAAYIFSETLAIALYGLSVGGNTLMGHIYASVFAPLATPANASLLYALSYVMLCWIVMAVLYRKGIFLKI
jgi:predicted acyltransferase